MVIHSSILAWKIPWMEEPGGVHGVANSRTRLSNFTSLNYIKPQVTTLTYLKVNPRPAVIWSTNFFSQFCLGPLGQNT